MKKFLALLLAVALLVLMMSGCTGSKVTTDNDSGVYYEIFVRAFADSNGDGIGDLQGLISKLNYLNDGDPETDEDLGITGIWLMPIFASGTYHGYDVDDYYKINPDYGTDEDFAQLIEEAHARGISVMLDLPINHTSTANNWFVASQDPDSDYRDWYRWSDGSDADLSSSIWGHNVWNEMGSGQYYAALFWSGMPDLNFNTEAVREECKNIAAYWLEKGCDGFRFDAAMHVFNAGELYNDESDDVRAMNIEWWTELREHCLTIDEDCFFVGEVWSDDATDRPAYAEALGSEFNFNIGSNVCLTADKGFSTDNDTVNAIIADKQVMSDSYGEFIDSIFIRNHDQPRYFSSVSYDLDKAKTVASMYMTMSGLPFMYYGEEIAMVGGNSSDEEKRLPFVWGEDDPAQTSWMESDLDAETIPASQQLTDEDSLLNHYRKIIRLRLANSALYDGEMSAADPQNKYVSGWYMESEDQKLLVLHNLSDTEQTVTSLDGSGEIIFDTVGGTVNSADSITLPAHTSVVIDVTVDAEAD